MLVHERGVFLESSLLQRLDDADSQLLGVVQALRASTHPRPQSAFADRARSLRRIGCRPRRRAACGCAAIGACREPAQEAPRPRCRQCCRYRHRCRHARRRTGPACQRGRRARRSQSRKQPRRATRAQSKYGAHAQVPSGGTRYMRPTIPSPCLRARPQATRSQADCHASAAAASPAVLGGVCRARHRLPRSASTSSASGAGTRCGSACICTCRWRPLRRIHHVRGSRTAGRSRPRRGRRAAAHD